MTGAVAARQFLVLRENRAMAMTDGLTGLANRVRLREAYDALTEDSVSGGRPAAVLLIDLDDFKPVNDQLGHEAGDTLLIAFASVLKTSVRAVDLAARLGGDEFAVVLRSVRTEEEAILVARRILTAIETPVEIAGKAVRIRASIGIAFCADGVQVNDLMRQADIAMYDAKRDKTLGWSLFAPGMGDARQEQSQTEERLEAALDNGEMVLRYRAIVALSSREVIGLEALMCWEDPENGPMSADEIRTLVKKAPALERLDEWVLARAARQMAVWQRSLPAGRGLYLGVSLSPVTLGRDNLIGEVLAEARLDPHDLVLSVNETAQLEMDLAPLRRRGIRIALEGFGAGTTSPAQLLRNPVDILKLDASFVSDAGREHTSTEIARAVAGLAHLLHLDAFAENVETQEQVDHMKELGYDSSQGSHFTEILLPDEVPGLLRGGVGTVSKSLQDTSGHPRP